MSTKQFIGIDEALKNGYNLRAFTSGGGLRVVRIEDPRETDSKKQTKAYGEMTTLRPALILASKDYQAGGTEYECHYLTGTSKAEDSLDAWLLEGNKIVAKQDEGKILVQAADFNYMKVQEVRGETFEEARNSLEEIMSISLSRR